MHFITLLNWCPTKLEFPTGFRRFLVLPSHLPHLYAKREPLLMSMSDCLTVWLVGYFSLSLHTQSKREAEELRDTESRKWRGKKICLCCHLLFTLLICYTIGQFGPLPFSHQPVSLYNISVSLGSLFLSRSLSFYLSLLLAQTYMC